MRLEELGWDDHFAGSFEISDDHEAARVIEENRSGYRLLTELAELDAKVSGRFRHERSADVGFPAVGDWVLIDRSETEDSDRQIRDILPRKSKLSRKAAGAATREQVVAANIDTLIFVVGLDDNFSLRRIERYMTVGWNSGATPVLALNKADVCDDPALAMEESESVAIGVDIVVLSATRDDASSSLASYLQPHRTIALIGSSGVGKSTLLNNLAGTSIQETRGVRDTDSKGRHTTTRRQLFTIKCGTHIIDTPGMREFGIWDTGNLDTTFADITEIATDCRYRDCSHQSEPGCAVSAAVENGSLDRERFDSFLRLRREELHIEAKQDVLLRQQQKRDLKSIHRSLKSFYKRHDK